jgi:hypothetical protein
MPIAEAWCASREFVHLKPIDQEEDCDWSKSEQEVPPLDRSRKRLRVRDDKREKRDEPQDIHRPCRPEGPARAFLQVFRRPVIATRHHAQRADQERAHHGAAHHDFPGQGERRREKPDESLRQETERDGNDGVQSRLDAAMKKAVAASKGLDAIVRNTLRGDFSKLDQWNRSSEFGKAKPKRDEPAPTPQAPPPSA